MKTRPSFEIIPSDPREALEWYERLLTDLSTSKPKDIYDAHLIIELIQNARVNIRRLKDRINKRLRELEI